MISLKTDEEIRIMAEGGKILAEIIKELEKKVEVGITTKELNRVSETLIFKFGGMPSFKNYQGFPATLCTSINEEIVHSIPSERKVEEGDLISLDLGMKYKGYHTDMAITLGVGNITSEAKKLIKVTQNALKIAIKEIKPGKTFGDLGYAVENYVEKNGFNVVRELCGHGIGKEIHEDPQVLNYGRRGTGLEIKSGMVFCIEPMVTIGDWHIKKGKDGYGFETKDGSLSCHFEHTIAVVGDKIRILTVP